MGEESQLLGEWRVTKGLRTEWGESRPGRKGFGLALVSPKRLGLIGMRAVNGGVEAEPQRCQDLKK